MHTWSLAVEEQFYLAFPPILALLWRGGRRGVVVWLAVIALLSLAFAEWGRAENAARNFFFTGGRVWELLAGSLAALWLRGKTPPGHQAGAALGLALILGAVLFLGPQTPFPSVWTLIPVAGTLLVILCAAPGTLVGRLLALPLPVGIGLVSYSAYLWHQPLFAFARLGWAGAPPGTVMAGLAVLTFALAALTWRYIEQPFRRRPAPLLPNRKALFAAAALGIAAFLAIGIIGRKSDGFESAWRAAFPDRAAILDTIRRAQDESLPRDDGACRFNAETVDPERLLSCAQRHGPGIVVLGDSHAIDLFGIVTATTEAPFVAGVTQLGCRPWTADRECPYGAFDLFLDANPGTFDLILFEISGAYLLTPPAGARNVQTAVERLAPSDRAPDLPPAKDEIAMAIDAMVRLSSRASVVWIGPRIEPQVPLDNLIGRGCAAGLALRPNTAEPYLALDGMLASEAKAAGVIYLSQNRLFDLTFPRDFGTCDGLLWSDGDHYSALGETTFAARADLVGAARAALAQR